MISAHPLAAKGGLEIYKQGGNVVDAAVATAYCLGVVEPHGSGIGGEGMMLIYLAKEKKFSVIDFKAIAPAKASYRALDYKKVSEWSRTVKGASIPGAVAGLELAREKFGRLDRKKVLHPAIEYALKGFEVDSTLALNFISFRSTLEKDEYAKKIYYPGGVPAVRGSVITNPDYGKVLMDLSEKGADAFYRGEIASLMIKDAEKNGGYFSREDLIAYKPVIREPLIGNYRGYDIVTTPPPCGGMHLIETLNILKYFDMQECRKHDSYSLHLLAETFRMVYIDEASLNGDPAFSSIDAASVISEPFAFRRFRSIDLAHSNDSIRLVPTGADSKNTTQLCVMDAEGNAVSLTITLSSLFGTAHTVEGAGFMLNNEMQNFNPDSMHINALRPHKRVVTSLVPTIVMKNGTPVYVLGTPGGDLIISTIAQVIINLIDYNMELSDAVFAPRMFSTFYQKEMEVENRFTEPEYRLLESLGHSVKKYPEYKSYFGAVQSIQLHPSTHQLIGVSDPRRSGAAVGE
jgi:gamma-glutamyltranspeptidase/glutathione hydrolase